MTHKTTQVQMRKIANTLMKFSLPLILSGILYHRKDFVAVK